MTVAIMQPYLFPYPGYFHLAHAADAFVVYGEAQYIRRGYVNRNRLDIGGGERWFTLPVEKAPREAPIDAVGVDPARVAPWRQRFLETFRHAYAKTPYYAPTRALLEGVLAPAHERSVGATARASVAAVTEYLRLDARLVDAAELDYDRTADAQAKIIGMAGALGATRYVNAAGGRALYDADAFAAAGLALRFVAAGPGLPPPYRPGLSILDALCKFAPATLRDALSDYALAP